jgi:hypothetical protein
VVNEKQVNFLFLQDHHTPTTKMLKIYEVRPNLIIQENHTWKLIQENQIKNLSYMVPFIIIDPHLHHHQTRHLHISSSQSSLSSTKLDIIATPHINHEPTNICCGKKNKNNNKKLKYVVLDQFLETTILNCLHYSFHPIRPNSAFLDMRF